MPEGVGHAAVGLHTPLLAVVQCSQIAFQGFADQCAAQIDNQVGSGLGQCAESGHHLVGMGHTALHAAQCLVHNYCLLAYAAHYVGLQPVGRHLSHYHHPAARLPPAFGQRGEVGSGLSGGEAVDDALMGQLWCVEAEERFAQRHIDMHGAAAAAPQGGERLVDEAVGMPVPFFVIAFWQ